MRRIAMKNNNHFNRWTIGGLLCAIAAFSAVNSYRLLGWYSDALSLLLYSFAFILCILYLRDFRRNGPRNTDRKGYVKYLIRGGIGAMIFSVLWFFLMMHAFSDTVVGEWLYFLPTLGSGVIGITSIGVGIYLKSVD
jgi:hypothetical protein